MKNYISYSQELKYFNNPDTGYIQKDNMPGQQNSGSVAKIIFANVFYEKYSTTVHNDTSLEDTELKSDIEPLLHLPNYNVTVNLTNICHIQEASKLNFACI